LRSDTARKSPGRKPLGDSFRNDGEAGKKGAYNLGDRKRLIAENTEGGGERYSLLERKNDYLKEERPDFLRKVTVGRSSEGFDWPTW